MIAGFFIDAILPVGTTCGSGWFCVSKLGLQNFRQIVGEFEAHSVKVNDLKDESKSSDDK